MIQKFSTTFFQELNMQIASTDFILALTNPEKLRASRNNTWNKVYPATAKDCVPQVNSARPDFGEGTAHTMCNVTKTAPEDTKSGTTLRRFKCTAV